MGGAVGKGWGLHDLEEQAGCQPAEKTHTGKMLRVKQHEKKSHESGKHEVCSGEGEQLIDLAGA